MFNDSVLEGHIDVSLSSLPALASDQEFHITKVTVGDRAIQMYTHEYWTARQRQASSIHEVSYRACFKPQLPRYFIQNFTKKGDIVYDPFSGRGTTGIEAGILERNIILNDVNPLSTILAKPRFALPEISEICKRLQNIDFSKKTSADIDLSMFYHKETESELVNLKWYLEKRRSNAEEDEIDRWIRLVATTRLTGHSSGFFSVYSLSPNQTVSQKSQMKINEKRQQSPSYRNIKDKILKKSKALYRGVTEDERQSLQNAGKSAIFLQKDARNTPEIRSSSIDLVVTSPPFLNVVDYYKDNWLRCWFNSLDIIINEKITVLRSIRKWTEFMFLHFRELYRILKKEGWICLEVGEINKEKIKLEESIIPVGIDVGFTCKGVLINQQSFSKTSNIWGIKNNNSGTNTNRIVLFQK